MLEKNEYSKPAEMKRWFLNEKKEKFKKGFYFF